MHCENCKVELDETMLFCWSCGAPIKQNEASKNGEDTASDIKTAVETKNELDAQHETKTTHTEPLEMAVEQDREKDVQTSAETTSANETKTKVEPSEVTSNATDMETNSHEHTVAHTANVETADVDSEQQAAQQVAATSDRAHSHHAANFSDQVKDTFLQATERINRMVGEEGQIDLNLRDVFSDIFKKHSKEEAEKLFITGTELTTPKEKDISTSWPKPWLFARIFVVFAITYLLLSISAYTFDNIYAIPGLIVIGSFAVPFSLLIFFWETNAPRNISIYEIAKMFFIGGAASLVTTLILYSVFPVGAELTYGGAIVVGIVEEVGKLVIIAYFIYNQNSKYILNGLLIGAAIGAGFAAFESAGYAFAFGMFYGDSVMTEVIFLRAWLAIGTHTVWSAIAGAALVYVKGNKQLSSDTFVNAKFIQLFAIPVILHAVWDMPLYALHNFNLLFIILIVIAWIFIFTLMNAGLKQIGRLHRDA